MRWFGGKRDAKGAGDGGAERSGESGAATPLPALIEALTALLENRATPEQQDLLLEAVLGGRVGVGSGTQKAGARGVNIAGRANVIVTGDGNIVIEASSALAPVLERLIERRWPAALHQIPPEDPAFTGRAAEEAALLEALEPGAAASIGALNGMGGIGKSALAARAARRLTDRFPDAQLWMRLNASRGEPLTPLQAMTGVIRALEPLAPPPETEAEAQNLYRTLLSRKRCLIVLDDARDAAQVRPLLPPPPSAALITSRAAIALSGCRPIRLDCLPAEDAAALLRRLLADFGREAEEAELTPLAEGCRHLPLALHAAAAFLGERKEWTVARYLEALRDRRTRMARLLRRPDDPDTDVYTVLGLSLERLEETDAETARDWLLLGIFPATFDARAAALWQCETDTAAHRLSDLRRAALLELAAGTDETPRFRLHDFMRDLADAALAERADGAELKAQAEWRFARHYRDVLAAAKELFKSGGEKALTGLGLYDREAENIAAGQRLAAARWKQKEWTELAAAYPDAGAHVLSLRLHPREWIEWLETQLTACRGLGDRRGEGNALGNLGIAWKNLGEPRKAIEYHEQHLAIAREIGDRRGEGAALGNLGIAWARLGETRKTIELYEQRLAIAREIGDRRGEGNALGNLGIAWKNLGETEKAIDYYEKQLAIAREIGDRRGDGTVRFNMALSLWELGEKTEAVARMAEAREIYRAIGAKPQARKAEENLKEWQGGG